MNKNTCLRLSRCVAFILAATVLTPTTVNAQWVKDNRQKRQSQSPWKEEEGWTRQSEEKLIYGLKNTLMGWTELFTEPYEAYKNRGNIGAGIGEGIWNALGTTAGGALHTVTFPITGLDIPLPEGGVGN